MQYIPENVFGY